MQTSMQAKKLKHKLTVYKKSSDLKTKGENEKKLTKNDLKKKFRLKRDKDTKIKSEDAPKILKKKYKFKPKFKGSKNVGKPKSGKSKGDDSKTDNTETPDTKKNLKRKNDTENEATSSKKAKLMLLKKKERKLIRQKKKKDTGKFERGVELKTIWEELRKDDCAEGRKIELLGKAFRLIKTHVKELCYAHDTVRVLECVFGLGSAPEKQMIFSEIDDAIIPLAKSKYGKFLLIKVLRNGTKEQKNKILVAMHSRVIALISHSEAAEVVEVCFNECASTSERMQLTQEFYGPSFKYFKDSNVSLKKLLENEPNNKPAIIQHMKEAIVKCFQKTVIKHSLVHYVLRELLIHADPSSRAEIIEIVRQVLVEILHTKDGARATMYCIWHGTKKDRKVIIKTFKTHVVKISQEEHGHLVLLSIFDSVDDTNLVKKYIISELLNDISTIMQNSHGRKVLLYLISPRDSVHFSPDLVKILQEGDDNKTSVKDAGLRKTELKEVIIAPLVKYIAEHISESYKDNTFCLAVLTMLKHAKGHCEEAFNSIAELVTMPYSEKVKNIHIIESPGSHFMLKKLVSEEKDFINVEDQESFSKILMKNASAEAIKSWTECNRGCFLLIGLVETGIEEIIDAIKTALHGFHKQLSKKPFSGASILLKKIKQ